MLCFLSHLSHTRLINHRRVALIPTSNEIFLCDGTYEGTLRGVENLFGCEYGHSIQKGWIFKSLPYSLLLLFYPHYHVRII